MRIISNAEAREMSDARQIMANCLWQYRMINKQVPLYFTSAYSILRYRSFCFDVNYTGFYTAEYDTEDDTLHVEAYGKDRELIKIMIFE